MRRSGTLTQRRVLETIYIRAQAQMPRMPQFAGWFALGVIAFAFELAILAILHQLLKVPLTIASALAAELVTVGVATLRYQFPYMEQRRGRPDSPAVATATVAAAVRAAWEHAPDLPLFAGGKSFGGRMTSQAAADRLLPGVRGVVFFGFPLHAPNKPGTKRAEHLKQVTVPMLFLQGTRDTLADLTLLRPICRDLGPRATLHVIETADHSFHVLVKSGKTDGEALRELAQTTAAWALKI